MKFRMAVERKRVDGSHPARGAWIEINSSARICWPR